ncbi:hypothetical protein AB833_15975 [Chromatiales bacterium (ex Bugula neritina AB1)]|nr:hypothetical protein AB833_15975 [Chromatiales bacterium (ex Bugula neritina AB1)]
MTTTKTSVDGKLNGVSGSGNKGLKTIFSAASRFLRKKFNCVRDLNDAEFLSLFDIPEVSYWIDNGFNIKAHAALLEHFRDRVESDWLLPPAQLVDLAFDVDGATDEQLIERANLVLDYDLEWSGVPPEIDVRGSIDWQKNILQNQQWLERINRHSWWPLLGHAYQKTGDERYARAFATQLSAWMNSHSTATNLEDYSCIWSSKQIALRLRVSWIPAFGMFFNSPYFTTTRKLEMLRSIFDQTRFLRQNNATDNLLLNGGLVSAGISFPELHESGKWRKAAIDGCRGVLAPSVSDADSHEFQCSSNLLAYSDREIAAAACAN